MPLDQVTGWEFTNRIYFYDLWKDLSGDRVLIRSNNSDVQVQAFIDSDKLYVALNNLDDFDQPISLNMNGNLPAISNVRIKSLTIHSDADPDYTNQSFSAPPKNYTLKKNETTLMEYTFSESVIFDNKIESERYYSSTYLQPIQADQAINFNFNNITTANSYSN